VTGTLAELERKLRELERELTSIGRRREAGDGVQQVKPPQTVEPRQTVEPPPAIEAPPASERPPVVAPPPAQALEPQPTAHEAYAVANERSAAPQPTGRLVDEAIEPAQAPERARPSEAQLESLAELRRFRDRLERFGRELAAEYDALLGRVMSGLSAAPAAGAQAPRATAPAPAAPEVSEAEARESTLFEGRVELGVGPFYDIGALGAFEQRLAGLPGVSEASVRRFEASHAVVDVRLAAPVALVKELRHALSSDFSVREVASGRILLTFDDA
jgi:hypothetical protein